MPWVWGKCKGCDLASSCHAQCCFALPSFTKSRGLCQTVMPLFKEVRVTPERFTLDLWVSHLCDISVSTSSCRHTLTKLQQLQFLSDFDDLDLESAQVFYLWVPSVGDTVEIFKATSLATAPNQQILNKSKCSLLQYRSNVVGLLPQKLCFSHFLVRLFLSFLYEPWHAK